MRHIFDVITAVFSTYFRDLDVKQSLLVALDVLSIAEEEHCNLTDAALKLRYRIGGSKALADYSRSLEAGYNQRGN